MINSSFIDTFDRNIVPHLPNIHDLSDRLQVLWVLAAAKASKVHYKLTAADISTFLREICGVAMSRQRVAAILGDERGKGTVAASRANGILHFELMKHGEDAFTNNGANPVFVDPQKALSAIRAVEEILRSLEGDICVCDTYVDSRSLDYLAQLGKASNIRVLTENVQDSGRMKRDLAAFAKEHPMSIELRVSPKGQLHDRYLLHAAGMLYFGASLKDTGNKQSMVVALPKSFAHQVQRAFDRHWSIATKFG